MRYEVETWIEYLGAPSMSGRWFRVKDKAWTLKGATKALDKQQEEFGDPGVSEAIHHRITRRDETFLKWERYV